MIAGVNTSLDQGVISTADWRKMLAGGRRFVVHRAVEGLGSIDPCFAANLANSRAAGLVPGAYFPLHPDLDPVKQADDHYNASGGLGSRPGELAPWCDCELMRGKTPAEVLEALIAWCNRATVRWERKVLVYTYRYFDHEALAAGMIDGATLAGTNLAMAAYQANPPTAPAPWTSESMLFWQDTGGQPEPGITVYRTPAGAPCDTDVFLGDEQAFADAQPVEGMKIVFAVGVVGLFALALACAVFRDPKGPIVPPEEDDITVPAENQHTMLRVPLDAGPG